VGSNPTLSANAKGPAWGPSYLNRVGLY
jgi:hypothetical protein